MSQQGQLSTETPLETLTGNTGGPVPPDGAGNINILGDGFVEVAGNPGTNTLTISDDGTVATTFTEDTGSATAVLNNINVFGGTGIDTSGAGDTITIAAAETVAVTYTEDAGTATPSGNNLNVLGDAGIETSGAGDTITISAGSSIATSYVEDTGTAHPSGNVLNVDGGNGISTTGSGNTITIDMESPFIGDFTFRSTTAGDTEVLTSQNSDNTAASDSSAVLGAVVGGTTQIGDPSVTFVTGTARSYSIGSDTSDSQILKINTDASAIVNPSSGTEIFLLNTSSDAAVGTLSLGHGGIPVIDINFTINGAALQGVLSIDTAGDTDIGGIIDHRHSDTAAFGGHQIFLRSRGTHDAETIVQSGDTIYRLIGAGYDGTDYAQSTELRTVVDGTPGANDMPGRFVFLTSQDGSQTPTEALRIDSSQQISFTQYTQHSMLFIGASGLVSELGPLTDGQLAIGSTGADPVAATLTEGTGISITNGAGTITIAAAGAGVEWSVETGTTHTLVAGEGVFANNGAGVTLTLPTTAAVGDAFEVVAMDAAGFTIDYSTGQSMQVGSTATTTTTGTIVSTGIGDWVQIVCNVANTGFFANVKQGNVTLT